MSACLLLDVELYMYIAEASLALRMQKLLSQYKSAQACPQ